MTTPSFDYFLTYARNDQTEARELVEHLEAFGITIGCDFRDGGLRPGEPWVTQLEELMQRSASYLILVGERGVDRWVQAELDVALNRNVNEAGFRIYPLLLPGVSPVRLSQFLGRFEAIPLAADWRLPGSVSRAQLIATLRPPDLGTNEICPFPGLRAFDDSMAAYFFGRSAEIQQLVKLLGQTTGGHRRWLQIEGASGSGKSSLARAALLPAIERGWLSGAPRSFRRVTFRPGRQPLHSLALALLQQLEATRPGQGLREIEELLERDAQGLRHLVREHTPPEHGLVILLDQLEELFSLASGDLEPARQLDALLAAALEDTDSPFYLVTTIRSDFLGEVAKLPALVHYLNTDASRYLLAEISAAALTEAVRQPALLAGLRWESESLPTRIVEDAGVSPGSLPLVAHVLREMWERDHVRGVLTNETYDHLGGVGGALARSADGVLDSLSERERAVAKKIFLSLVQVQRGSQESRRVLGRGELLETVEGGGIGVDVLARLSGARDPKAPEASPPPPRLLSVRADENVELVHEALLRNWETLGRWMDESREALEIRNDVEDAARAWDAAGRPEDGSPRGKQLAYFLRAESVGSLAREFLAAGHGLEERARRKRRQQRQGLRLLASVGGVCLLVGIVAVAWNYQELYVHAVDSLSIENMESATTPDSAIELADQAERDLRRVLGNEPSDDSHRLALARIAIARGNAFLARGRLTDAAPQVAKAIELLENVDSGEKAQALYMVQALAAKGRLELHQRSLPEAVAVADQIARRIEETTDRDQRLRLLSPLFFYRIELANELEAAGSLADALDSLKEAVSLLKEIAEDPEHKDLAVMMTSSIALAYNNAGQHATRRGETLTALAAFQEAARWNERLKPHVAPHDFARQQATLYMSLGWLALQRNDREQARQAYELALQLLEGFDVTSHPQDRLAVFNTLLALADLHTLDQQWELGRERLADASKLLDRQAALGSAGTSIGELQQGRSWIEFRLGNIAHSGGNNQLAGEHFERACELAGTLSQSDPATPALSYQYLVCLDRLARLADEQGWRDRLEKSLMKATAIYAAYPARESLATDPQVAFLLRRIQQVR